MRQGETVTVETYGTGEQRITVHEKGPSGSWVTLTAEAPDAFTPYERDLIEKTARAIVAMYE